MLVLAWNVLYQFSDKELTERGNHFGFGWFDWTSLPENPDGILVFFVRLKHVVLIVLVFDKHNQVSFN